MSDTEELIEQLSERDHVLTRPGMYIGNTKICESTFYLLNNKSGKMEKEKVIFSPLILKLTDEIAQNAADFAFNRKNRVSHIGVEVNVSDGFISVFNDGKGIPIKKHHQKPEMYIPEFIFTQFRSGSNFNDKKVRLKGGLNGVGAKITVVFSKKFIITTQYGGKRYTQIIDDNMDTVHPPTITKESGKDFTKIVFYPDFKRVGSKGITKDTFKVLERRIYDLSAFVDKKITVSFNNKNIAINSFADYCKMFMNDNQYEEKIIQENDRWSVAVTTSATDSFESISFVNGVVTHLGGTHINYVLKQAIAEIKKKIDKASYSVIKDRLMIIVFAKIENPEFTSQSKDELYTEVKNFGSTFTFTNASLNKIKRLSAVADIKDFMSFKEKKQLSQGDGKKTVRIRGIDNLDDANKAGTKDSHKCTLFVTEGLSAKTFASMGLVEIGGRDINGVFPLKGKPLNVRTSNISQIANNVEIKNLKTILGLKTNHTYESVEELMSTLRYGKLCILTDQDLDGYHIRGLLMNLFHSYWPVLIETGFVTIFNTPIVKVKKGKDTSINFYNLIDYNKWQEVTPGLDKYTVKYYKGLGSSSLKEAKEAFKTYKEDLVTMVYKMKDEKDDKLMDRAFSKTQADERKKWIRSRTGIEPEIKKCNKLSFRDFFDTQFVQFSIYDCQRSIPGWDGLKPSQRKILYGAIKKGPKAIKLDQLRGYVSEITLYAHGDMSLVETMKGMAQNYVGSGNNIPLLNGIGNYGTRIAGGADSGQARYISIQLAPITRLIFRPEDDPLLEHHVDTSTVIEPKQYFPIIPMMFVNSTTGIGTGYSAKFPSFSPIDIIDNILGMMQDIAPSPLIPWYRNNKGKIDINKTNGWISNGIIERITNTTMRITELPIGMWTQNYKKHLNDLIDKNFIKSFKDYSTPLEIKIEIKSTKEDIDKWVKDPKKKFIDILKLRTSLTKNYTMFDVNNTLQVYKTLTSILKQFYEVRLDKYAERKKYMLDQYTKKITEITDKSRFIKGVIDESIVVFRKKNAEIVEQLVAKKFKKRDGNYEHLLSINIKAFTYEKLKSLDEEMKNLKKKHKELEKSTPQQLWKGELLELRKEIETQYAKPLEV